MTVVVRSRKEIALFCFFGHLFALVDAERERLLEHHVAPGAQALQRNRAVHVVRQMMARRSTSLLASISSTVVYVSMPGKSFSACCKKSALMSHAAFGTKPVFCAISLRWPRPL